MMWQSGQMFGRYRLVARLGEGGFATVYRARDPQLDRDVALKLLHPHLAADAEIRRRFLAEAQVLARLHSPYIVSVHDFGEANGMPYFAMELVEGQPLSALLASAQEGVQLPQAKQILRDVATAIDALHAARIVHRDIKPSNVMIDSHGRAVLMDFGIPRSLEQTQYTQAGVVIGTPGAMSPEQIAGRPVGPPADIYALGVLAYQLLAGKPPFAGDTTRLLYAHLHERPPDLRLVHPGLPEPVYAAVAAALEKNPAQRPASAENFITAFTGAAPVQAGRAAGTPAGAGSLAEAATSPFNIVRTRVHTAPVRRSSLPMIVAGGAAVVLTAVIALVALLAAGHRNEPVGNRPALLTTPAELRTQVAVAAVATSAVPASTPSRTEFPTLTRPPRTAQPPSPTDAPPAPLVLNIADVSNTDSFGRGQGPLHVCFKYGNGIAGSFVNLRVAAGTNDHVAVTQDVVRNLDAGGGAPCQDAPSPGQALEPGSYRVLIYTASWDRLMDSYPFDVAAAPAPPSPVTPPTPAPPPPSPPAPTTRPPAFPQPPSLQFAGSDGTGVQLRISEVRPLTPARFGSDFVFIITAMNTGSAPAGGGSVTVSSGDASLHYDDWSCNGAGTPGNYTPGSRISGFDTSTGRNFAINSIAPMVEVDFKALPPASSCSLTVRSQPQTGTATYLIRVAGKDGAGVQRYWPVGGSTVIDQQGYPAVPWRVSFGP